MSPAGELFEVAVVCFHRGRPGWGAEQVVERFRVAPTLTDAAWEDEFDTLASVRPADRRGRGARQFSRARALECPSCHTAARVDSDRLMRILRRSAGLGVSQVPLSGLGV